MYRIYRRISNDLGFGFNIETTSPLSEPELKKLHWLIAETFEPNKTGFEPYFVTENVVQIGPRLPIETPFSSNAVSICKSMGLSQITRIERTHLYQINDDQKANILLEKNLDRMVEQHYPNGIISFDTGVIPEDVQIIDLLGRGKIALEEINKELGLSMDKDDIDYYFNLFVKTLKRNPTDVELFQIGNANSEHSRHWFFKGQIVIDGVPTKKTLLELVQEPLKNIDGQNRTLKAFNDNAGVLRGFGDVEILLPINPGFPSELALMRKIIHITCTAETHNHPTGVSPYGGGATGAGGRIRDNMAVGIGGLLGIGVAGYSVGNLFIPGYEIPGEIAGEKKPSKYASPISILIEGSNAISDYGNQIGEPLTVGFLRTFGQIVGNDWREYRKPILYTGGVGSLFNEHVAKEKPVVGMKIVRIGGPAYPIGVGGGSASSMQHGENSEALDFNSVQRGNAEMENKANRVLRTCSEMGENNPISSLHDQGAGGPSNVLTELLDPVGGTINIRNIVLGDKTMPVLKIWSAEFQEGYGLLITPEKLEIFKSICKRERVNCEILGEIDGSGKVVVTDPLKKQIPVDLNLEQILSKMPQKTFKSERQIQKFESLYLSHVTIHDAIEKVLKLPSVGSKGFLVHKVDRSVTGLVAQQQTCGIAQIPISDVSVNAQSHFGLTGSATSIGEQPIKMLIDPKTSRMSVGEMLTNMAGAKITNIGDIRTRLNWMWPAKLPHEGALLYDAAVSATELMIDLGIACDGGKDSASMASDVCGELVKAPGTLVVLGYAPMLDITKKITPDIKKPGSSLLALIDLGKGKNRLGGSALAQAYNQLDNECPDVDDPVLLKNAFLAIQQMVDEGVILSIHDRSDGGLFTTVAEMCMASRCGFKIQLSLPRCTHLPELFSEELGFVIEVDLEGKGLRALEICHLFNVPISIIAATKKSEDCSIVGLGSLWESSILHLRNLWESTSSQLEEVQKNACAKEEHLYHRISRPSIENPLSYNLTFNPKNTRPEFLNSPYSPRVAILREEGTNGDREMQAAYLAGGLMPFDVTMSDLLESKINLDDFRMIIFAGGFSYMDVFDSAKGWAGAILFNDKLRKMFDDFYNRSDTLSLGVCNGCQLMALLGWVPRMGLEIEAQPRFVHNVSGKFESRWVQVEVLSSPSVILSGMEGSKLGVWVAHGEGRLVYPNKDIQLEVEHQKLAPLAYLDPYGKRTERYPYNPNGSPDGTTALCSSNGRHLAMMPHPERCFRLWQLPWMPSSWNNLEASPWLKMFQNARAWCMEHKA